LNSDSYSHGVKFWAHRVRQVMGGDAPDNRTFLEKGLYCLSRLYGIGARLRAKGFEKGVFAEHRLPCRVVSVGNLTTGGSGKTPMTLYLAQMLEGLGLQPVVISRGYKGTRARTGGVVSDGCNILMDPAQAGDEPVMMASQLAHIPFLVGADRYMVGEQAIAKFSPDVILLDDAFQHRGLYRDINLLLVDAAAGFGNGHLLPRGILREPLDALGRADAVVISGRDGRCTDIQVLISRLLPEIPVFRAVSAPFVHGLARGDENHPLDLALPESPHDFGILENSRILGFSGIGRNQSFKQMLTEISGSVLDFLEYPDHHAYSAIDLDLIARRATAAGADCIVTTQKDFVRIRGRQRFPMDLLVIGIHMDFGGAEKAFSAYVEQKLSRS